MVASATHPVLRSTVLDTCEYVLTTGERHRNTELITVREGRIVAIEVYFGGRFDR